MRNTFVGMACLAASAACAGDMPARTKSAVSDNLTACAWTQDPGFYAFPGSDTCLKVGGYVRWQYDVRSTGKAFGPSTGTAAKFGSAFGAGIQPKVGAAAAIIAAPATNTIAYAANAQNNQGSFARGEPILEARTRTAYGTLRMLMQIQIDHGSGSLTPIAAPQVVDKIYVQWAGLTAGRAESFFRFYDNLTNSSYVGLRAVVPGAMLFAYTAQFGNGFAASLSVEDPEPRRGGILQAAGTGPGGAILTTNVASAVLPNVAGAVVTVPFRMPDVVGQLKLEQEWGRAQVSGVLHRTGVIYNQSYAAVSGFAALAGVSVNLPIFAKGDYLLVQATYASGAVAYLGAGNSVNDPGAGFLRTDSDFFLNTATGRRQAEKGYNLIADFRHYWTRDIWQETYFSYTRLMPGSDARRVDWTIGGIAGYREWRLGTQLIWSPVKSLTFGAEAMYENTHNTLAGLGTNAVPAGYRKDYSGVIGRLRINRIF